RLPRRQPGWGGRLRRPGDWTAFAAGRQRLGSGGRLAYCGSIQKESLAAACPGSGLGPGGAGKFFDKAAKLCYTFCKSNQEVIRSPWRHVEWGAKPRESVTVKLSVEG